MRYYSTYQSQFIEMFYGRETTPAKEYLEDSYPGEWGTEDNDGNGAKVIRTTNFTNTGKLNLEDVVTRNIEERKVTRKQIRKFDTILERSGGTTDNPVGRVVLFEDEGEYLCNNFTQVLRFKDIDPRYAFYALYFFYQTNKTAIRSMGSKTTGIQNLNMSKYLEIGIPNATQDEQNDFVRIAEQADKSKFSSLKSQFIEMFGSETHKVLLEDVVFVKDDCRKPINEGVRSEMKDGKLYPYYGATGVVDYINDYITDEELLCVAEDCGNYNAGEESAYIIRGKAWVNNHAHLVKMKEGCDIKYMYYYLKIANLMPYVSGTTRLKLTQKKLKEIPVILPTTDKQKAFVAIAEQADKSKLIQNNTLLNNKLKFCYCYTPRHISS